MITDQELEAAGFIERTPKTFKGGSIWILPNVGRVIKYATAATFIRRGETEPSAFATIDELNTLTESLMNDSDTDLIYEQELPQDITPSEYTEWFKTSKVVHGVRMGRRL